MVESRLYYCPTCNHQEYHQTNHDGEIYCDCKKCGNCPLYCTEFDYNSLPHIEATIKFYLFNLEKEEEKEQYDRLANELKDKRYKKFSTLTTFNAVEAMKKHDNNSIKLYNPNQFPGQYVSSIGRVHNWQEFIYPNNRVKEGYYIVHTS